MVCINSMNINEFHSYSTHQFKNLRHPCQRNYQPLIPQFLTIQLNYYFLITSVTFDHLSIQTTKTNILLTLQASYSIYNMLWHLITSHAVTAHT